MNTKKVYQSITKIVESYKAKLANQSEEEFTLTPPIGGWSYSEVYSHIFDASLYPFNIKYYIKKNTL